MVFPFVDARLNDTTVLANRFQRKRHEMANSCKSFAASSGSGGGSPDPPIQAASSCWTNFCVPHHNLSPSNRSNFVSNWPTVRLDDNSFSIKPERSLLSRSIR
jgi:hypothetical protein